MVSKTPNIMAFWSNKYLSFSFSFLPVFTHCCSELPDTYLSLQSVWGYHPNFVRSAQAPTFFPRSPLGDYSSPYSELPDNNLSPQFFWGYPPNFVRSLTLLLSPHGLHRVILVLSILSYLLPILASNILRLSLKLC